MIKEIEEKKRLLQNYSQNWLLEMEAKIDQLKLTKRNWQDEKFQVNK